MKTKPKIFDAVAASRQWREDAGRRLDAMPLAERVAYLEALRTRGLEQQPGTAAVVREDAACYDTQNCKEEGK